MVPSHDVSPAEHEVLHELQLGIEHLHRSYGELLTWHHRVGRAMDHLEVARRLLADPGHPDHAAVLRDEVLPAGTVGDDWFYEVIEAFREGFLADVNAVEGVIRANVADGETHVSERLLRREWRARAADASGDATDGTG